MLALYLGRMRHLSSMQGQRMIEELRALPDAIRKTLGCHDQVKQIAEKYADAENMPLPGPAVPLSRWRWKAR